MKQDNRVLFDRALGARPVGVPPGEFVGQESFMTGPEIRPWPSGPGSGRESRCWTCAAAWPAPGGSSRRSSAAPISAWTEPGRDRVARDRAAGPAVPLRGRRIPPMPPGPFDVVLLLETMLAFARQGAAAARDRDALPVGREVRVHRRGGPAADRGGAGGHARRRHGLAGAAAGAASLPRAGRAPRPMGGGVQRRHRGGGRRTDRRLRRRAGGLTASVGGRAVDELLAAHRLWSGWLAAGRVRKFALVAEKTVHAGLTCDEPRARAPRLLAK